MELFTGAVITRRRRMLTVSYNNEGAKCVQPVTGYAKRSAISSLSEKSAGRLRRYVENFAVDFTGMVTLTYPERWPDSPQVWKKHLNAFFEALRRTMYFDEHSAIWVLEFQKRGAPHFHLLIDGWMSKAWIARAWGRITSGNEDACSRVETLRDPNRAGNYISKYLTKSLDSNGDGVEEVGRWWGVRRAKILRGAGQAIPTVAAAIFQATPWKVGKILLQAELANGHMWETPCGWNFYGTEQEIQRIWHYLMAVTRFVDLNVKSPGCSQLRMWVESYADSAKEAYLTRK